jgi:cell division initiation protein
MALTPLAIRKIRFHQKIRGYSPSEVEEFLNLVADELGQALSDLDMAQRQAANLKQQLEETQARERKLQDTLLKAQHLSDEIVSNAQREAQLLVREAEMTADKILTQAMEQASHVESRISDLRTRRREMQLKFRNTLDLYAQILDADTEEEQATAIVRRLPRKDQGEG